jgi:hypothetical protein
MTLLVSWPLLALAGPAEDASTAIGLAGQRSRTDINRCINLIR